MLLWENVDGTCRKPQFSWCVPSKADFGGSRLGDTSCASQGECCLALLSYGECYTITLSDKYHNNDNTEKMPRKWYTSILYTRYILRSIYIYIIHTYRINCPQGPKPLQVRIYDLRSMYDYDLQSTVRNLQFTIYDLQPTIYNLRFTIYDSRCTVYGLLELSTSIRSCKAII